MYLSSTAFISPVLISWIFTASSSLAVVVGENTNNVTSTIAQVTILEPEIMSAVAPNFVMNLQAPPLPTSRVMRPASSAAPSVRQASTNQPRSASASLPRTFPGKVQPAGRPPNGGAAPRQLPSAGFSHRGRDCDVVIMMDSFFVNAYPQATIGQKRTQATADILKAMQRVDAGYMNNFQVGLPVSRILFVDSSNDQGTALGQRSSDLNGALKKLSNGIRDGRGIFTGLSSTCAVVLVTYQNTDRNLGTAFVGSPMSGGICDRNGYNAVIINTNYQNRMIGPNTLFGTLAHEIGHTFGASHDPTGNPECGYESNPHIMYPIVYAKGVNADKFSSCSLQKMLPIIQRLAPKCFKQRGAVRPLQFITPFPVFN